MKIREIISFVVLISLSGLNAEIPDIPQTRIIDGEIGSIVDYPYTLSLRRSSLHLGGATAIGQFWGVSAARILLGTPSHQVSLRAGSNERTLGGSLHNAQNVFLHPLFNSRNMDSDVAAIQVLEPFQFGQFLQPVWLDVQGTVWPEGRMANMTGWGITQLGNQNLADVLKVHTLQTVSFQTCNDTMSDFGEVTSNMLCTAPTSQNICHGDYGGPLVSFNVLIGIASWNPYCGSQTHTAAFTRIAAPLIRHFIRETSGI